MKNSLKGALTSGLIFPGLGQILLKQYLRGISIALLTVIGIIVFVINAVEQAFIILEKIEAGGGAYDMNAILNAASEASTSSASNIMNLTLLFILLCWVGGTVDAFIQGRKKDLQG